LVTKENDAIFIKWSSLIAENRKKCLFNKEKSLIGLTPEKGV
jgi:hypothetical protein